MQRAVAGVLGFIVAPLVAAVLIAAITPLVRPLDIPARLALVPMLYIFSFGAAIAFGLPTFAVLFWLRLIRWWTSLGAGVAIGALLAVLLEPTQGGAPIEDVLFMAAVGAASTLTFWLIWRWGREGSKAGQRAADLP